MNYFKESDFNCQETGENQMTQEFYEKIDALREQCGFAFIITSGYRSTSHSIEKKKADKYLAQYESMHGFKYGTHTQGIAADIKVKSGTQRGTIVRNAIRLGFNGIGIHRLFVHVDLREGQTVVWPY